jgi:hypothetical protein
VRKGDGDWKAMAGVGGTGVQGGGGVWGGVWIRDRVRGMGLGAGGRGGGWGGAGG